MSVRATLGMFEGKSSVEKTRNELDKQYYKELFHTRTRITKALKTIGVGIVMLGGCALISSTFYNQNNEKAEFIGTGIYVVLSLTGTATSFAASKIEDKKYKKWKLEVSNQEEQE